MLWHNVYNFGRFFAPFLVMSIFAAIYAVFSRIKPNFKNLKSSRNFLVASLAFIILHVLAMSQIIYPTRAMLPAYIFGVAIFVYIIKQLFFAKASERLEKHLTVYSTILLGLSLFVLIVRSYFAISYYSRITPILEEIRTTESDTYCVSLDDATSRRLPYIYLAQEDFLVDWAMPQTIYGKTIYYCDD